MALGELNLKLSADTAQFMSDMGRAAHAVDGSIRRMQSAFATLQATAVGFGAAIGVGAFAAGVKNLINQADELGKLSQKVGVSVENLSALKYAAELSDLSMEGLTTGLKKLATNMFEASAGGEEALRLFKGLNIEFESAPGKLLPTDEVLLKLADKFKGMEDGAAKSALAVKLFGRNGLEMIPFLNQGRDGIARLREELEKLGGVMTGEMAKKAEEFNDNLKSLAVASNHLKIEIGNQALPALIEITNAMKEAAKESGFLYAAWVGLGGVASHLLSGSDASQLKSIQAKIAQHQINMKGMPPSAQAAMQRQYNALLAQEAELANRMAAGGAFDGPAYKKPGIQPDATMFGADGKPGKTPKEGLDVGRQWMQDQEEWNKTMAEAAQLTDDYYRKLREGEERIEAERMKAWLEFIDRESEREEIQMRLAAGFDEHGKAIEKAKKQAYEFGYVFSSAIEDAILKFKSLGDVARAVMNDIARMVLRKAVTEPIGNKIGGIVGKALEGIFGGGGASDGGGPIASASGGYREAGQTLLVGEKGPELFVPSMSGTVIPNHGLAGGGGSFVQNLNIHFSANTPAAVRDAVMAMVPGIVDAARAGVGDGRRRNHSA